MGDKRAVQCEPCAIKMIQEEPKQEIVGYKLKPSIDRMMVDSILKNSMPIWNDEDKSVYFIRGHVAGSLVAKMKELQVLDLWFTPIYEDEEIKSDWVKENHLDYYYKEGVMANKPKQETLEEFPVHNFMSIEPSNKKQQKELENNRARLGVKNKEEDFVLKCLLSFDWKREVILYEVEKVSFTGNMIDFRVRVKAPHKTVDYCCSNPFKETGWSLERPDFNSRAWEVWSQLNRYIKR
jgi:hypothetical protein